MFWSTLCSRLWWWSAGWSQRLLRASWNGSNRRLPVEKIRSQGNSRYCYKITFAGSRCVRSTMRLMACARQPKIAIACQRSAADRAFFCASWRCRLPPSSGISNFIGQGYGVFSGSKLPLKNKRVEAFRKEKIEDRYQR